MELQQARTAVVIALEKVLKKKETRKEQYIARQEELVERCRKCPGSSLGAWYCEDCSTGRELQNLDAEYSDVNNWWSERFAKFG